MPRRRWTFRALPLGEARKIGLLVALGADLGPGAREALAEPGTEEPPARWLATLRDSALTNHGRLELAGLGLTASKVLALSEAELRVRLGGLSNRQRRAIRRKKRKGRVPASLRRLEALSGEVVTPARARAG